MKVKENGTVTLTQDDIKNLENIGCSINWHTPYYLNGASISFKEFTVGFYNWLDGANCCIGDNEVKIKNRQQYNYVLNIMRSIKKLNDACLEFRD
jgi:hypothetical protein